MKLILFIVCLICFSSCASQNEAQKRHIAYKKNRGMPQCVGKGCK